MMATVNDLAVLLMRVKLERLTKAIQEHKRRCEASGHYSSALECEINKDLWEVVSDEDKG